jgi:hypothetical protein
MTKPLCFAGLLLVLGTIPGQSRAANGPPTYPPPTFGDTSGWGRNIQRTMRLLATSTPQKRNTVRILFYGQSITEQPWWQAVADDLRARFPHANLVIENRALGGYASQLLVKTSETDLYPFYPDLLIFYVYGAHDKYEDIIRRVRERTTAEILQQNDHVTSPADFTEETDPAKLWPPDGKHWGAFMNHNWLPAVSKRYGTELCDQRGLWKRYLTDNGLQPKQLLIDGVHLNAQGDFLMAECVKAHLRYDPRLGPAAADRCVKTYEVGKDIAWREGKLRLAFEGNRVDLIVKPGAASPAAVRIDGRRPSEFPELYGFTRTRAKPGGKFPPIAPLKSEKGLQLEDWTMEVVQDRQDAKQFHFTLQGSRTGPDGEGRSDRRFVSRSGRIVIEPEDWNVAFALMLAQVKPVPDRFTVTWSVVPHFVDEFVSPGVKDATAESTVTLAQELTGAQHVLEIAGSAETPIAAVRVYHPPGMNRGR